MLLRDKPSWIIILPVLSISLAILFSLTTFTTWKTSLPVPFHNDTQSVGPQFHFVIAQYEADPLLIKAWTDSVRSVPYFQDLGVKMIIYTKDPSANLESLRSSTTADEVHRLPNVGREGGTYLHHLIQNYHDPPAYTLFSQAEPQHQLQHDGPNNVLDSWYIDALRTKLTNSTGFLSLIDLQDRCDCAVCGGHGLFPLLPQIYTLVNNELCHGTQIVSLWGQFIVLGKRIRSRPLWVYEYLRDLVNAGSESWIHDETEPKVVLDYFDESHHSKPSIPLFGHTIERAWSTIFNCSSPGFTVSCDGPGGCVCVRISQ